MPSLKDLRVRIDSVKSTKKITSAMKMVAASKLRRAQEQAEAGRPYAERMDRMLGSLAGSVAGQPGAPKLLAGTGKDESHLFVLVTANRGLCGGFNTNAARKCLSEISASIQNGKDVKIITVGSKGYNIAKRLHSSRIIARFEEYDKPRVNFAAAAEVSNKILELFEDGAFDRCILVYNAFKSVVSQPSMAQQIVPFSVEAEAAEAGEVAALRAQYEFEPGEAEILEALLPRNLSVQIYSAMLDSAAGEQAARMTAMDNATRNAGEMIDKLTLTYNRTRQAFITKELIEIISGAEAV